MIEQLLTVSRSKRNNSIDLIDHKWILNEEEIDPGALLKQIRLLDVETILGYLHSNYNCRKSTFELEYSSNGINESSIYNKRCQSQIGHSILSKTHSPTHSTTNNVQSDYSRPEQQIETVVPP